jgi:ribosomal protein S18 acetylase RimI-like enzyme
MTNVRIEFEIIDDETFPGLKALVIEQARHHSSTYRGDDKAFVHELQREHPVAQVLMARDADSGDPLGYILFNHNYGLKGQELYIEDILVSGKQRSQGLGLAMTEELKAQGRHLGIDAITWTVADNNPKAIGFYENKMHASQKPSVIYDCGHLFAAPPAADPAYEVRRADKADLELLESYVGRIQGLDKQRMANIASAASAEHAEVFIALSSDGVPKALAITNSNYSSFRTVYGYKCEIMALAADDAKDAVQAFHALAAAVVQAGKAEDHTGHLNLYIDKNSPTQQQFVRELKASPLQMTDDPASVFLLYGIGRDIIYAPLPQPKTPSATPAVKPPEPPKPGA